MSGSGASVGAASTTDDRRNTVTRRFLTSAWAPWLAGVAMASVLFGSISPQVTVRPSPATVTFDAGRAVTVGPGGVQELAGFEPGSTPDINSVAVRVTLKGQQLPVRAALLAVPAVWLVSVLLVVGTLGRGPWSRISRWRHRTTLAASSVVLSAAVPSLVATLVSSLVTFPFAVVSVEPSAGWWAGPMLLIVAWAVGRAWPGSSERSDR